MSRPQYRSFHNEDSDVPLMTGITVHETDDPQPTGLLDAYARPLYRVREKIKFGFTG